MMSSPIRRFLVALAACTAVLPSACAAARSPDHRTLLQVSTEVSSVSAAGASAASDNPRGFLLAAGSAAASASKAEEKKPSESTVSTVSQAISSVKDTLKDEVTDLKTMTWKKYWHKVLKYTVTWAIWTALALLIYGCGIYPDVKRVFVREDDPNPKRTFETGHFGCFKSPRICLCSFCCPMLRWADTEHMIGLLRTPVALTIYLLAAFLNDFLWESLWFGIITSGLIIFFRHKLRAKLSLPNWTFTSCCIDLFFVCFCPCCAIAQEARVANAMCQLEAKERAGRDEFAKRPFGPAAQQWVLGDSTNSRGAGSRYIYRSEIPGTPYISQGFPGGSYPPAQFETQGYAGSMLQQGGASSGSLPGSRQII